MIDELYRRSKAAREVFYNRFCFIDLLEKSGITFYDESVGIVVMDPYLDKKFEQSGRYCIGSNMDLYLFPATGSVFDGEAKDKHKMHICACRFD